jgi:hypothetical protein
LLLPHSVLPTVLPTVLPMASISSAHHCLMSVAERGVSSVLPVAMLWLQSQSSQFLLLVVVQRLSLGPLFQQSQIGMSPVEMSEQQQRRRLPLHHSLGLDEQEVRLPLGVVPEATAEPTTTLLAPWELVVEQSMVVESSTRWWWWWRGVMVMPGSGLVLQLMLQLRVVVLVAEAGPSRLQSTSRKGRSRNQG